MFTCFYAEDPIDQSLSLIGSLIELDLGSFGTFGLLSASCQVTLVIFSRSTVTPCG